MIKKFLGVLLSILILSSSIALTAYAEDNPPAGGNPATNDEAKAFNAETYDYKSLINSMWDKDNQVENVNFIGLIRNTETDCIALVHATGYPVLTGIEHTEIGDYVFASADYNPDTLGLYIVHFTKRPLSMCIPEEEPIDWRIDYTDVLKNAAEYGTFNMREVYHAIKKAQKEKGYLGFTVEHKDGELGEKCAAAIEKSYGFNDYQKILDEIGDYNLVYGCNKIVPQKVYQEELGSYIFSVSGLISGYPLGLYLVKGDTAYSLKDAYDKKVISDSDLDKIAEIVKKADVKVNVSENPALAPTADMRSDISLYKDNIRIYISGYAFTGSEIKPEVYVANYDEKLTEGKDYIITYEDNINIGTGKVIVTGIGAYKGEVIKTFNIIDPKNINTNIPENNLDYVKLMSENGVEVTSAKYIGTIGYLGDYNTYALVYAYKGDPADMEYRKEIDGYVFSANHYLCPDALGLYVVTLDRLSATVKSVDSLESAVKEKYLVGIKAVCKTINEYNGLLPFTVKHKDGEIGEECYKAIEEKFGEHDHYGIIGEYSGAYLVYARNDMVNDADYSERIGNYTFYNNNQVGAYELGLYVVKGVRAYTLKQAYSDGIIKASDVDKIAEDVKKAKAVDEVKKDLSYRVYKAMVDKFGENDYYLELGTVNGRLVISAADKTVSPKTYTEKLGDYEFKTENPTDGYPLGLYIIDDTYAYTLKEAYEKKVISNQDLDRIASINLRNCHGNIEVKKITPAPLTPEKAYIKFKSNNTENFELDLFKRLKDGIYVAHQKDAAVNTCAYGINIDKYTYWITDKPSAVYIFDYRNYKEYALDTAFEKGIITKTHLAEISKLLDELQKKTRCCPTLYKTEEYVRAGERTSPYCFGLKSIKKMTISNKKVVKFVSKNKGYVFVGLKKGTATVKLTPKKGKPIYEKIIVKDSPKLTSKKGKTIKTLSVKLGKTAKVYIKGKAGNVNNKYKNTKYAKVTSKKTAKKISVQGLKRGKSTIKVVVNNVTLKLKVKVK